MPRDYGSTWLIVVMALALLGIGAWLVFDRMTREERPAIIVKGGSVVFVNEQAAGGSRRPWERDGVGEQYKPTHPKGLDVGSFVITSASTDIGGPRMIGRTGKVTIAYRGLPRDAKVTLKPDRSGWFGVHEPKLHSDVRLKMSTDGYELSFGERGGSVSIELDNGQTVQLGDYPDGVRVKPAKDKF